MTRAPLYHRAWTVQERLLAPRVLTFASDQLYWECETLEACESAPAVLPRDTAGLAEPFKSLSPYLTDLIPGDSDAADDACLHDVIERRDRRTNADPDADGPVRSVFDAWANIVETYSRGVLTREEDRLVALAGIAREMAPLMRCAYYAGLWERHLPRQLTWRTYMPAPRPERYHAPSWSWVAVNSPVEGAFDTDDADQQLHKRFLVEVLQTLVTPLCGPNGEGADGMMQVADGHMRVRGRLFDAHVYERSEAPGDAPQLGRFAMNIAGTEMNTVTLDSADVDLDRVLRCLPVAAWYDVEGTVKTQGLVLEDVDEDVEDGKGVKVFRRVGCFDALFEEDDSDYACLLRDYRTGATWNLEADDGSQPFGNLNITLI